MAEARKPIETRQRLLDAAFKAIHRDGYEATGLSRILAETGLTKGALYHHFTGKAALGHAVIEEIVGRYIDEWWVAPLVETDDPLSALETVIQYHQETDLPKIFALGCPLNNLSQELSARDEGSRQRLEALYRTWRRGLARALTHGQHHGGVRADADVDVAAAFIVGALEGAFSQSKTTQNGEIFGQCMAGLRDYLATLRP